MEPVDRFFAEYVEEFLKGNRAGRLMADALRECGVGLMPLVDHCTLRTHDVDRRARELLDYGFQFDAQLGVLEYETWWAKVYRKPGYPAMFVDQAFTGERGRNSPIPQWVDSHGDQCFHHIAIRVEDIDQAIATLQDRGIEFAGQVVGEPGSDLRQIFTRPETRQGQAYSVLELIERHHGFAGFSPPQAHGLMESSRLG